MEKAVEIVTLDRSKKPVTLQLNHQALEAVLSRAGSRPITLISIVGPFGTGKSFLLTLMVRYLNYMERLGSDSSGSQDESQDWLLQAGVKLKGFPFESSTELVTPGIHLWSKPYIFANPKTGEERALLLMDTRGIFEECTSLREWAGIVGTTLALSSFTILNVSRMLQEDTLSALKTFLDYGRIISGNQQRILAEDPEPEDDDRQDSNSCDKYCEQLMLLIRDWNNPDTHDYGMKGGQDYVQATLGRKPGMTEEAVQVRSSIIRSTKAFNGYLLPHPGVNVTLIEHNSNLDPDCLEPNFEDHLRKLVELVLHPEHVQTMTTMFPEESGTPAKNLLRTFDSFINAFNSTFTSEVSALNASAQLHYEMTVLSLVKFYDATVPRKLEKKNNYKKETLDKIHNDLRTYLTEEFQQRRNYDPKAHAQYLARLEEQIDISYQRLSMLVSQQGKELVQRLEGDALREIQAQLEELTIADFLDPDCSSELEQIASSTLEQFQDKLKKVDKGAREEATKALESAIQGLYEEAKSKNEGLVQQILKSNEEVLSTYLQLYETTMDIAVGAFKTQIQCIGDENLETLHNTNLSVVLSLAEGKFRVPPKTSVLLQELMETLKGKIQQLYEHYKEEVEEARNGLKQTFGEAKQNLLEELRGNIREITTTGSHSAPQAQIQQLTQLFNGAVRSAQAKIATLTLAVPDKSVAAAFKSNIISSMQGECDTAVSSLQAQIEIIAQHEDQVVPKFLTTFQQACEGTISYRTVPMDPAECTSLLAAERSRVVQALQDYLLQLKSIRTEELTQAFLLQAAPLEERLSQSNKAKYQQVRDLLAASVSTATSDFRRRVELSLKSPSCSSEEEIRLAQGGLMAGVLLQFDSDTLGQAPVEEIRNVREELQRGLQARSNELLRKHSEELDTKLEEGLLLAERKVKKFVDGNMNTFAEEFDLVAEENFKEEFDSALKKALKRLHTELLNEGYPEDLTQQIMEKTKLKARQLESKCWGNIEEKNEETERKIRSKIGNLKSQFSKDAGGEDFSMSKARNSLSQQFLKSFCFSSDEDKRKYQKSLETELLQLERQVEMGRDESARKVSEAKRNLLQSFESSAAVAGGDASRLDEIVSDHIRRFSALADDDRGAQEAFSGELRSLADELRSRRQAELGRRERDFQCAVREIEDEIKYSASSSQTEEQHKKKHLERVEEAGKKFGIDVAAQSQAMSELSQKLEEQWKIKEERARPLAAKLLSEEEIQKLAEDAKKFYRELMLEQFKGKAKYLLAESLSQLHSTSAREAIRRVSNYRMEPGAEQKLRAVLDEAFKEFDSKNKMNAPTSFAIGIDLGTTYCCVGVYIGGKVQVIPNNLGKLTTPSYVYIGADGKTLVGNEAKDQSHVHPERTVYEVKRLIGRQMTDPAIQEDLAKWPFKVVNEKGIPKVLVDGKTYHPEEISAQILIKMKQIAEAYLKQPVTAAVITVPAYFNEGQRQATKNAGEAAGLEVLRIINEPTAAAIAYNLNWTGDRASSRGLVYDLGGGTFDVALYQARQGSIDILNIGGDTHLGGVDFDNSLVTHCVQDFQKQTGHNLIAGQGSADLLEVAAVNRRLMRLKKRCEEEKILLTGSDHVNIDILSIFKGEDLNVRVSREQFEQMIQTHISKSIQVVEKVLQDGKMSKKDVDEIVLIGGSTRIPRVQELLRAYFGKALSTGVNPDEAVAIGAAFEAAVLNGAKAEKRGDLRAAAIAPKGLAIKDVTPMSYGLEIEGGHMFILIPKQSQVPVKKSSTFLTAYNNQTSVQIVIYEGDAPQAAQNTVVGEFYLNGIPPGLAGRNKVKVTMEVDLEGIITVTAVCEENGVDKELKVRAHKKRMTSQQIAESRARNK